MENVPAGQMRRRRHEQSSMVRRRQILGMVALILMLLTIVALAAIGQPWVAGVVAGGLATVVAIFVTGQQADELTQRDIVVPPDAAHELPGASAPLPDSDPR